MTGGLTILTVDDITSGRRRFRRKDEQIWASLRVGEAAFSEGPSTEVPIVLCLDDEPMIAMHVATVASQCGFDAIGVTSEEAIIDLIRSRLLPVHRVACIIQDYTRPVGSFSRTIGRYRKDARKLYALDGPAGDLVFYLRDQFFPRSSLIFCSAVIDLVPIVGSWASRANNVFAIVKPFQVDVLRDSIKQAVERFKASSATVPLSKEGRWLLPVAAELASLTAIDHSTLERMSPRQFEELIGAIFSNHGFSVALTQQTRDGGYDLKLLSHRSSNDEVILVECKKYNPRRAVDVGIVRSLYGVKTLQRASSAYLVTSSHISPYAKQEFETVVPIEMRFFERNDVIEWCLQHLGAIFDIAQDARAFAPQGNTRLPDTGRRIDGRFVPEN